MAAFSVIVPIYKVEPYLRRCVDSILEQSFRDFELVLVDDGSPDGSGAICDEYAQKDSRVRVIHKENGGLSSARNAGLDLAAGKYVCFVDGDDAIHPELLSKAVSAMEQGAELTAFHFQRVWPGREKKPAINHQTGSFTFRTEEERRGFLIQLLDYQFGWEAWSRIFVREIIEKYRLRFEDNRRIFAEDLYFSLCYCAHIQTVVSLPDVLYDYYIRGDSIMGKNQKVLNVDRMNELSKAVLDHYQHWPDCECLLRDFPIIHYLIIDNVVKRAHNNGKMSYSDIRDTACQELTDLPYFQDQMRQFTKCRKILRNIYSAIKTAEMCNWARYLGGGSSFVYRWNSRVIHVIHIIRRIPGKLVPRR